MDKYFEISAGGLAAVREASAAVLAKRRNSVMTKESDPDENVLDILRDTSVDTSSLGLGDAEVQPMDPAVPVFKVAMALIRECLWKGKVGIIWLDGPPLLCYAIDCSR